MNIGQRIYYTLSGAFLWDNPFELILDCHLLGRRDPARLLKGDVQLIVNYRSSDVQAAKDILIDGMYDAALLGAVSQTQREREFRYLNLGANVGAFDVKAWQIAKTHGLAVSGASLEMNTATFARLVLNLELNNLLHITAINAALAEHDGQIPCELAARDTGQSVVVGQRNAPSTTQMIPAMSWETLWRRIAGEYDLVKVDIEGAERFLLQALTAHEARRLRYIVVETHSADLHDLCDRRLTHLDFTLVKKENTSDVTRLSLWKQNHPAAL